jgi:hypothetical protein
MPIYEMMKVFDCQWNPGMPPDVQKAFFALHEVGNDVYVSYDVDGEQYDADDPDNPVDRNRKIVDKWLVENGAEDGETVLIKHWW